MTNGIVTDAGLETQFGEQWHPLSSSAPVSDPPASFTRYQWYKSNLYPSSHEGPAAGCFFTRSPYQRVSTSAQTSTPLLMLSPPRNGWDDSRSSTPSRGGGFGGGRGGYDRGNNNAFSRGGGTGGGWGDRPASTNGWYGNSGNSRPERGDGPRESFGFGVWRDGVHIPGGRNMRLEKELFGDPNDPNKQHTGINFEKYDDIPVEANGAGVPEPVLAFTNPPLDPVLLENIGYASYTTPTPVQKYSIPIVAGGRDLMACAQVSQRRRSV